MYDYWNLFWATGMPEAWTLSRKLDNSPEAYQGIRIWSQNVLDPNLMPGEDGRRAPEEKEGCR